MSRRPLRAVVPVPPVDAPVVETDVPPPPERGLSTIELETWLELAPQVSERKVYDPSLFTAFKLLVRMVAATEDDEDLPETARARNRQAAQAAMGRWGLSPQDRKHASKAETGDEGRRKWRRR